MSIPTQKFGSALPKDTMVRKNQPAPEDVHVDRPLTNMSVAEWQPSDAFIADFVAAWDKVMCLDRFDLD